MSLIVIQPMSGGACRVVHQGSGAVLETDLPPEYGGAGRSFSATDLVGAALGVCITTNIDRVAERHGIPLDALRVSVDKTLASEPKRIARLAVSIEVSAPISQSVIDRLLRAARHCTVHRSLHPDVAVEIRVSSSVSPGIRA